MTTESRVDNAILRQAEQHLMGIENKRNKLLHEIARARRELRDSAIDRKKAVLMVGSIKSVLGLPLSSEEAELCEVPIEKASIATIPEDVFKDMTLPEAAKKLLVILGRPATNREMAEGLRKGGVSSELAHLENSLRSAMQRRPDMFVFMKDDGKFGEWHLTEWIEASVELPEEFVPAQRGPLSAVPPVPVVVQA